jgi:hypothetical protein
MVPPAHPEPTTGAAPPGSMVISPFVHLKVMPWRSKRSGYSLEVDNIDKKGPGNAHSR